MQLLATAAASLALMQAPPPPPQPVVPAEPPRPAVESTSLGTPSTGRLRDGVPFPPAGEGFFTWDPILKQSPNRVWRRYAPDRTVARILRLLAEFRPAHPAAPRVGVGDLSRPKGGVFDRRYGGLGHASHQNGLDVDVYYPRRDRLLKAATRPSQVDRLLAQGLVTAVVRAGATDVFVGPSLGLRGPRGIVTALRHHDDHLHARFPR